MKSEVIRVKRHRNGGFIRFVRGPTPVLLTKADAACRVCLVAVLPVLANDRKCSTWMPYIIFRRFSGDVA